MPVTVQNRGNKIRRSRSHGDIKISVIRADVARKQGAVRCQACPGKDGTVRSVGGEGCSGSGAECRVSVVIPARTRL